VREYSLSKTSLHVYTNMSRTILYSSTRAFKLYTSKDAYSEAEVNFQAGYPIPHVFGHNMTLLQPKEGQANLSILPCQLPLRLLFMSGHMQVELGLRLPTQFHDRGRSCVIILGLCCNIENCCGAQEPSSSLCFASI
jgi:hypothetical protein